MSGPNTVLRFADFEADLAEQELRRKGVRVPLELQPFRLLALLLERRGTTVTRDELRRALWPDNTFVDFENGLNTAIRKIRRALGDSAATPRFVETLPRRGYRFVLTSPAADNPIDSIAVLPFENLSGDPEQEYFSDGLTDALITHLAKVRALKVISRTSVMQYKGARKPLPKIADELGVEAVLEGSVQKEGNRVRVSAQLIEAASDRHLWAESYDRSIESVLKLQSEVARTVTREIRVQLSPAESSRLAEVTPISPAAYESYLRGRFQMYRGPQGIQAALTNFNQTVELGPNSALGYAGLANVHLLSFVYAMAHPREAGPRGLEAARRAVDLDPALAEGFVVLGALRRHYEFDWAGADEAFQKALDLSSSSVEAYVHRSGLYSCTGRPNESEAAMMRALELDPLNLQYQEFWAFHLTFLGRFEEAIQQTKKVLAREPERFFSQLTLWPCQHALGRHEESYEAFLAAWKAMGDQAVVEALKNGRAGGGYAAALRAAGETLAARADKMPVLHIVVAMAFDFGGDTDRALDMIERGYRERDHGMAYFHRKPFSDRVKNHPRYREVLRKLRLPT